MQLGEMFHFFKLGDWEGEKGFVAAERAAIGIL